MKTLTQEQMLELAATTPRLIGSTNRKLIDEAMATLSLLKHKPTTDTDYEDERDIR